jgi:CheY-like chemotaxis protein
MTNVLIVDDSPIGRHVVEAMLADSNFTLHFAVDGLDAYNKAFSIKPDIIILDIMMPKIDGIEVTKMIRETEGIAKTPIIILTALDDRDTQTRAKKAGANEVLVKPLKQLFFLAVLKRVIQDCSNSNNSN